LLPGSLPPPPLLVPPAKVLIDACKRAMQVGRHMRTTCGPHADHMRTP